MVNRGSKNQGVRDLSLAKNLKIIMPRLIGAVKHECFAEVPLLLMFSSLSSGHSFENLVKAAGSS